MEIFKIVFLFLMPGNDKMITVYINEANIIMETHYIDLDHRQSEFYDLNKDTIYVLDNDNKIEKLQLSKYNTNDPWVAFPPLSIDSNEVVQNKEMIGDKLYVKTKTERSFHEYELIKFPIKSFLKKSFFLNTSFDEAYNFIVLKKDFRNKYQEVGNQKVESIEKISEEMFDKIKAKFR